jgi:hypothetical protein
MPHDRKNIDLYGGNVDFIKFYIIIIIIIICGVGLSP